MAEGEPEMQGKAVEENSPAKAEKSKDELWETCVSLQEELNRTVKEKRRFENERSSLTTSWNTSKQRLEASKARMREKLRERQQNLEELKTAQQEELYELKMAAKSQIKKGCSEVEMQEKKCSLQVERAEQEVSSNILMRKLELEHQEKIKELYVRHEERVKAVDERYETWVKAKKDEQSQEHQTRLDKIDEEMRVKRDRVLEEQDCKWTGIDFERKPLTSDDEKYNKALKRSKATCTRILSESRDQDVKNIQLELKIEQAENENEQLRRKHTEALLDIQQKNGMKHLLLERKIQSQTETQERLEIRLWVAQAVVQKDQTALKNIKELFKSKEATIAALKDDMPPESKQQGSDSLMQSLTNLCISDNDPVRRDVVKQNSVSTGPDDELLRLS
ncbi:hypothetical protein JOQ06_000004, partial [Pogonophryne albipinna]